MALWNQADFGPVFLFSLFHQILREDEVNVRLWHVINSCELYKRGSMSVGLLSGIHLSSVMSIDFSLVIVCLVILGS